MGGQERGSEGRKPERGEFAAKTYVFIPELAAHSAICSQNGVLEFYQIDLLIDRRDQVINLCECKFSIDTFSIDKDYSEKLRSKIATFKAVTKTRKSVFLTMVTTYGVEKNPYANLLVQNEVTLDELFE